MSQEDLLQNEVIEELIRERSNSYLLQNKQNDFWILISPKFLENKELISKIKKSYFYKQKIDTIKPSTIEKEFYGTIISTNKEFIKWIQLRLGYFEDINNIALQSVSNADYVSNGIYGKFDCSNLPLSSNPYILSPKILINKYKKLLDFYYLTTT
jgi:hypothetical protein